MTLASGNWNYPTTVWFGNGRIADLAAACANLGIHNPLFVADKGLDGLEIVERARAVLRTASIQHGYFFEVQGNPTGSNVDAGVAVYRSGNHDGVIAFGGGSAMDAAKCIALIAGQRPELSLWDLEDVGDNWLQADADKIAPIIAVPTTAGTGSEVGRAGVILDERAQLKKIIFHPKMLPAIIISDPELTIGLPANITAWTGVDALVHAVEAYCAPGYHPMADGIAIEAIRMVFSYLPRAVQDGSDLEARGQMLVAASMGATAFQKGLGSIHSVAHVLGARYNTHHGLANAVLLPYGLKQNSSAIEARMQHLCKVLDLPQSGVDGFIAAVLDMRKSFNIPHTLAELGIGKNDAVAIGLAAFDDPSTPSNAKPINATELQALFEAAVDGDMERLS